MSIPGKRLILPTYKGFHLGTPLGRPDGSGRRRYGNPEWHAEAWDPAFMALTLDRVRALGCFTVAVHARFDVFLNKDSSWGTGSYKPNLIEKYLGAWEELLSLLRGRGMSVVVTLMVVGDDPRYNVEPSVRDGADGARIRDYMSAIRLFISQYTHRTLLGRAVAAWIAINEARILAPGSYRAFLEAFYGEIRTIPYSQPVGVDISGVRADNWTGWIPQFEGLGDFLSLHLYNDLGWVPDVASITPTPFIIGECGASLRDDRFRDPTYALAAVPGFFREGQRLGAGTCLPWEWWNQAVSANGAYREGDITLSPVAEWIREA